MQLCPYCFIQRLDSNGNGRVSLAEIDKFVSEQYPILNNKPALMRTYKLTISPEGGGDGDDWVVSFIFHLFCWVAAMMLWYFQMLAC